MEKIRAPALFALCEELQSTFSDSCLFPATRTDRLDWCVAIAALAFEIITISSIFDKDLGTLADAATMDMNG
jgi:hypothetical protein